jgi:hypothetical protein
MIMKQIIEGLHQVAADLGNQTPQPDGWTVNDWAYVRGIAAAVIWHQADRILAAVERVAEASIDENSAD